MKAIIILALVAAVAAYENTKYEKLGDVELIIANDPELKSYVDCFNDDKLCTPQTQQFKPDFADIVLTACSKCNDLQKHIVRRFLEGSGQKFPQEVSVLLKKLDPQGTLAPALKAAVANH